MHSSITIQRSFGIIANVIVEMPEVKDKTRQDNSEEKRVELHAHTHMSQMDGVSSASSLIKRADSWGMKAIAITDHGVVQSFPEANSACKGLDIKVIYGVEAYLVADKKTMISTNSTSTEKHDIDDTTYCVLDIETTGLHYRTDKITEIGIIKIKDGEVLEEFECFVNPEISIPSKITELTGITDAMVKDADTIEKVIPSRLIPNTINMIA